MFLKLNYFKEKIFSFNDNEVGLNVVWSRRYWFKHSAIKRLSL